MRSNEGSDQARRPATEVPGITGIRLLPHRAEAQLVNMSPTGLLVESPAKMQVGSPVTVAFEGGFTPETASGRVVRCEVAVMGRDGLLRYHLGIEFEPPLEFESAEPAAAPASTHVRNRW